MPCKFTRSSSFYGSDVVEFNLPAGWSYPFALKCLTKADRESGKQSAGKERVFTCYAAVAERYPAVREVRWGNFDALRSCSSIGQMAALIYIAIPLRMRYVRIHGGGDFFSQDYFDAWLKVVRWKPRTTFWAFTKSIPFWLSRLESIPENLNITASYGGRCDDLIEQNGLKFARVFPDQKSALASGLPIDTDDALAMGGSQSFALVDNYSKER